MSLTQLVSRRMPLLCQQNMVSVLIPTFQREEFVHEAVMSAVSQSYENLDIVICDDGSTDETLSPSLAIASADPRVRVYQQESNVGFRQNMQTLLELAEGSYIQFLGSDDLLEYRAAETLSYILGSEQKAAIATSPRYHISATGEIVGLLDSGPLNATRQTYHEPATVGRAVLVDHRNWIGELTTAMFRRADLTPNEFAVYRGKTYNWISDVSTWFTLLDKGGVAFTPDVLSSCRIHDGQEGHRNREQLSSDWVDLIADSIPHFIGNWVDLSVALTRTLMELGKDLILSSDRAVQSEYGRVVMHIADLISHGSELIEFRSTTANGPRAATESHVSEKPKKPILLPTEKITDVWNMGNSSEPETQFQMTTAASSREGI